MSNHICLSTNTWYIRIKKDKGTDYVFSWKFKGLFNSKLKLFPTAFLNSIKHSEYQIGLKFNEDLLAMEQNNYLTKIVNVYIAYDLDAWLKVLLRNSTLTKCLFGATNLVKNTDKEKYVYSGYG